MHILYCGPDRYFLHIYNHTVTKVCKTKLKALILYHVGNERNDSWNVQGRLQILVNVPYTFLCIPNQNVRA